MKQVSDKLQVGIHEVTPAVAQKWLSQYKYEFQRPVRQARVNFLAEQMRRGHFTTNTIVLALCGERLLMLNGQHTLLAIRASGLDQRLPVLEVAVENEQELHMWWSTLDIGRRRTVVESYAAMGLHEKTGLNNHQMKQLGSALSLILTDLKPTRNEMDLAFDRVGDLLAWAPTMKRYVALLEGSDIHKAMLRQYVLSIALVTLEDVPTKAPAFWRNVAMDDGLALGDPQKTLHRLLSKAMGKSSDMQIHAGLRSVAMCWNAHMRGRKLERVVLPNQREFAMSLLGTRYEDGVG